MGLNMIFYTYLKKNLHLGNEDTPPAIKGDSNDYVKIAPLPGVLDGTGEDLQVQKHDGFALPCGHRTYCLHSVQENIFMF